MDDRPPPQNQPIDLSSLEGLTLGTAWSESSAPARTDRREGRPDRRPGGGKRFEGKFGRDSGKPNRDRRERRTTPPQPPTLKVVFYPEETPFKALTKAIKASKRTYELFEIARLLVEKPECTVATVTQNPGADGKASPFHQSIADGAVFLTEAEALAHACNTALEKFFKIETVEVEAPKGNFIVVHKCGITGELIAPPNYHRYAQILNEHQAKKLPNMPLAAIQAKIESVKEPEVIAQWIESMKKVTRYTLLNPIEGEPSSFDGTEAATAYLALKHKAELIKTVGQARLTGKQIETLPLGELKRSIEVTRAMQVRFPLETANNLRGRLRRIGFNLYKRGQKGVSYISAVKRKFRTIGQTFAPDVQQVIEFIEKNPNINSTELPKQLLGITPPPAQPATLPTSEAVPAQPAAAPELNAEESAALAKLRQTLQWLIEEGYVIHFGNGALFVPPARQPNAPKAEGEEEEEAATETLAEQQTEASGEKSEENAPAESSPEPLSTEPEKPKDTPTA